MIVRKPCVEAGCANYVETQGLSRRQIERNNRCPDHQRAFERSHNRNRDASPGARERRGPAYRAIPKPIGLRCGLRIENICTGWATTWDAIVPANKGGTHQLSNLQPACRECNSSKRDRVI